MSMSCTTGRLCTTTSAARQTPDTSDVALVRSIAAGDKHAMRILFARHNVRVFRFVLRLVGDNSLLRTSSARCSWTFGVRPEDFRADPRLRPGC